MNKDFHKSVSLTKIVKAAASDLKEDYDKVKANLESLAFRGLREITTQSLRKKTNRALLPVNKNFSTVTIPCGADDILFVGTVDGCGYRQALTLKSEITPHDLEKIECIDKCEKCDQDKDICENMQVTVELSNVTINGVVYQKKTTKYLEGGIYYLVTDDWILDTATNTAKPFKHKQFITEFDMLDCACIAPTESNIEKVKTHCNTCYNTCYTKCREGASDHGGYRVFDEFIQLDRNLDLDHVYVEWTCGLPKVNGEYRVAEVAFETLVAWIVWRFSKNKKSVNIREAREMERDYVRSKGNMEHVLGRIKLCDLLYILN